jgi:hypothetical protein
VIRIMRPEAEAPLVAADEVGVVFRHPAVVHHSSRPVLRTPSTASQWTAGLDPTTGVGSEIAAATSQITPHRRNTSSTRYQGVGPVAVAAEPPLLGRGRRAQAVRD